MSIANEIQRLQTAKSNLKTQLEAKGVSVSANATLDAYPNYVSEINPIVFSGDAQSIIDGFAGGTLSGSINISSGNTNNLRDHLFEDMHGITDVTYYVDGEKSIGSYCFHNCDNLTSLNVVGPGKVTSVGEYAFTDCSNLNTPSFLSDLRSIGKGAFANCPLTGITFNSGLTAIGDEAFSYSNGIVAFSGQGITIPSNITVLQGAYSVGTFQNTYATGFTFLGNIQRLGHSSSNSNTYMYFRGNSQCELYDFTHNITVPSRVCKAEFQDSKEGYRIVVPQALYDKWITTQNWTGFTSHIVSGQNLYDVATYGYSYTGSTAPSITDKDGFSVVSNTASEGEGSITIYGKNNELFSSKNVITAVTIPSGVTVIGDYFCQFLTNLTAVTIPNSVTTIGDHAFWGCPFVNSGYTFPDGIVTIEDNAFGRDGDPVSIVDGAVFNIPDSVTHIGKEFLYHNNETGTTYINIGSGITSIGISFFGKRGSTWNHKLYLTIKAVVPPTLGSAAHLEGAFGGGIYVPAESVDAYKAANEWSRFANYIYPIPEE